MLAPTLAEVSPSIQSRSWHCLHLPFAKSLSTQANSPSAPTPELTLLPPAQGFPDKLEYTRRATSTPALRGNQSFHPANRPTSWAHPQCHLRAPPLWKHSREQQPTQSCCLLTNRPKTRPGGAVDTRQAPSSFGSQNGRWYDCKWHKAVQRA